MSDTVEKKDVLIVGGGLVGLVNSIYFGRTNKFNVTVLERKSDPRIDLKDDHRSINLTLSERGLKTLESIGIKRKILDISTPVYSRIMHGIDGIFQEFKYSQNNECLQSVRRIDLIKILVSEAEKTENVQIKFNIEFRSADFVRLQACATEGNSDKTFTFDLLIGNDGINSKVREVLEKCIKMNLSKEYFDYAYKEIIIPAENPVLSKHTNSIHAIRRENEMLLALPNNDGSFTGTLLMPCKKCRLEKDEIIRMRQNDLSDILPKEWENTAGRKSNIKTILCSPYHYEDKCVIMGDAAHAMTPFFGQGLNCGLEDIRILHESLKESNQDFKESLRYFTEMRKPEAEAISELSKWNFKELWIPSYDGDNLERKFQEIKERNKFNTIMNANFKDKWVPYYSMIAFSDAPYTKCLEEKRKQDEVWSKVWDIIEEKDPNR